MAYLNTKLVKKNLVSQDDLERLIALGFGIKSQTKPQNARLSSIQNDKFRQFALSDKCEDIKNPRIILQNIQNITKLSLEASMPSASNVVISKELDNIDDVKVALEYIILENEAKKMAVPQAQVQGLVSTTITDIIRKSKEQAPLIATDLLDMGIEGLRTASAKLEALKKDINPN
jgi:hypothetical protein